MSKILLTKKTSAIFLATVLVAGMIALSSPSFMTGAQAFLMDNNYEPDYGTNSYEDKQSYGKDNSYYKSKHSSNVKCNNINVNVNGFNGIQVGTLPTALNGLATDEAQAADEGEIGASSIGSGGGSDGGRPSGSDSDSRFVCIKNNNNVVEAPAVEDECPEAEDIEACFEEFIPEAQFPAFVAALESGITAEINGQVITLRSFDDICLAFEGLTSIEQLRVAVGNILDDVPEVDVNEDFNLLVNCIAEAVGITPN